MLRDAARQANRPAQGAYLVSARRGKNNARLRRRECNDRELNWTSDAGILGEKIGEGGSADIHAWAPGQVVKLFKPGGERRLSRHEAQMTRAAQMVASWGWSET